MGGSKMAERIEVINAKITRYKPYIIFSARLKTEPQRTVNYVGNDMKDINRYVKENFLKGD